MLLGFNIVCCGVRMYYGSLSLSLSFLPSPLHTLDRQYNNTHTKYTIIWHSKLSFYDMTYKRICAYRHKGEEYRESEMCARTRIYACIVCVVRFRYTIHIPFFGLTHLRVALLPFTHLTNQSPFIISVTISKNTKRERSACVSVLYLYDVQYMWYICKMLLCACILCILCYIYAITFYCIYCILLYIWCFVKLFISYICNSFGMSYIFQKAINLTHSVHIVHE